MIDDQDREDLDEARRDRADELRDIARAEEAADQEERAAAAARLEELEELELHVATVPVLDTGLGREAGFADDAELIAAAAAERAAMTPEVRAVVEDLEDDLTRRALFGESRA